jgi:hypothetical protein
MNQGTQEYRLKKKTAGRKSRETVPLTSNFYYQLLLFCRHKSCGRCDCLSGSQTTTDNFQNFETFVD